MIATRSGCSDAMETARCVLLGRCLYNANALQLRSKYVGTALYAKACADAAKTLCPRNRGLRTRACITCPVAALIQATWL